MRLLIYAAGEKSTGKNVRRALSRSVQLFLLKTGVCLWRQEMNRALGRGCWRLSPSSFSLLFGNRTLILFGRQFAQLSDDASKFSSIPHRWREAVYL